VDAFQYCGDAAAGELVQPVPLICLHGRFQGRPVRHECGLVIDPDGVPEPVQ
jgi:hypothetical protein